jgi:hypothetical protein
MHQSRSILTDTLIEAKRWIYKHSDMRVVEKKIATAKWQKDWNVA